MPTLFTTERDDEETLGRKESWLGTSPFAAPPSLLYSFSSTSTSSPLEEAESTSPTEIGQRWEASPGRHEGRNLRESRGIDPARHPWCSAGWRRPPFSPRGSRRCPKLAGSSVRSGGKRAAVSGGGTARPGLPSGGQAESGSGNAPDKRRAARGLALCEGLSQLLSHGRDGACTQPKNQKDGSALLGRASIRSHQKSTFLTTFARAGSVQIPSMSKKTHSAFHRIHFKSFPGTNPGPYSPRGHPGHSA
jgi:hypothetical protein